ncbi:MAG TPA: hypothetical protein VMI54_27930 [Polyangiaceae bacterium]|nr:hypothetical protein [Polyangiaceae bacterium]
MKLGEKVAVESLELELKAPTELKLAGTLSTPTAQAEFRRLLQDLHSDIVAARTASFAVDVQALSFVNSSAIRAFVDWISRAAHAGYTLAFKTSASVTWHRLSFSVLKSLAPATVEIVESRPSVAGGGHPS